MKNIITRRDFMKAGLVGLALASGGCASTVNRVLSPVFGRDTTIYDFNALAEEYRNNPNLVIPITSLDNFTLEGKEKGGMRLCELYEKKIIPMLKSNPMKGKSSDYSIGLALKGIPLCEEWIFEEWTGETGYPDYRLDIKANKFKSEEDCIKVEEKLKEWYRKASYPEKTNNGSYNCRIYSKSPFMVNFSTRGFINESQKQEHIARANLYEAKRGLTPFFGTY